MVTATGDQSDAEDKKAGDSYTLESSKAAHSVFRPCVEFLRGGRKKAGANFEIYVENTDLMFILDLRLSKRGVPKADIVYSCSI